VLLRELPEKEHEWGVSDKPVNVNPWSRQFWNLTEQGQIFKRDKDKANRLAQAAGHKDALSARRENAREGGAYRRCRQQSKTQQDYTERMPVRCQPANSHVFDGCLSYDFLQHL
jgi:hypothetical protein